MGTKSAVVHDVSAGHSFAGMSGDGRTGPDRTCSRHSMLKTSKSKEYWLQFAQQKQKLQVDAVRSNQDHATSG